LWKCVTVEPAMLSYFLGIFLLYSVFQPTVYEKTCLGLLDGANANRDCSASPSLCLNCTSIYVDNSTAAQALLHQVQAQASYLIKISTICFTVPSLVVDCFMGSWSDIFGRTVPLYLPSVGGLLATVVYILVAAVPSVSASWICLASLLSGMFGGVTSVIASCFSYIAATSSPETRTTRVSLLEGMLYLAGTAGPFMSGAILGVSSPAAVFAVSGGCYLFNIIYCQFVKEPPRDRDGPAPSLKSLFSFSHLKDSILTVFRARENSSRCILILLLISTFILQTVVSGELDILYLFLASPPLGWDYVLFSYFFGIKYLAGTIALLLILPFAKWLGSPDIVIVFLGILSKMGGLILLGSSSSTNLVFGSVILGILNTWALSTCRSMLSQVVEEEEIGKLFGVVAVLGDLASIAGTLLFNSIYPILRLLLPGAMFIAGGVSLLIPTVLISLTYIIKCKKPCNEE